MIRICARWMVAACLVGGAAVAIADPADPPTRRTGAPSVAGVAAESDCSGCHGDFALNSGGSVQITGAPNLYTPGATYDMTVRITTANTAGNSGRGWGFELTAVRMSNGAGTGTFANVAGQGTSIGSGTIGAVTRSYIRQSGPRYNTASPVDFVVRWTAPNPGVGAITFYAAGLAADGDGVEPGDWVYTASKAIGDTTTAAGTTSWGQIKSRYR